MARRSGTWGWLFGLLAVWASPSPASAFRFTDLEKLIGDHHLTRVDDLLPLLPEEYRRHYTFVYQSRSQQKANVFPDHPRAILYGEDAKFLIAFTKAPSESPAVAIDDTVETIEFEDASQSFVFRVLAFHDGQDPLDPPPVSNPATCLACHGHDPRPNWDSYNIWPGVYGSLSRAGCDTAAVDGEEARFYHRFLNGPRQQGRYANLPTELKDSFCPQDKEINIANAAVTDPNADLTQKLFDLNAQRVQRIATQTALFQAFQYFWAGGYKNCWDQDPESFFPAGYAQQHHLPSYQQTLDDLIVSARGDFQHRLARFQQANHGAPHDPSRQPINFLDPDDALGGFYSNRLETQKIKFLADRTGVNTVLDRWATAFTDGSLDYATPNSTPLAVLDPLFLSLAPLTALSCDELKSKSVAAIATLP